MWKRLSIYEGIIAFNFILNIAIYIVNKNYLLYVLPKEIAGYMFWLSLGLYLGFQLCKHEFKRVWTKLYGNKP